MSEYIFAMKEIMLHGVYIDSVSCEKKEEIVRCRDCKRLVEFGAVINDTDYRYYKCEIIRNVSVLPDTFCYWGERRDD